MSIISICKQYPKTYLQFDYNGIIVAIFSLLVAVLVGWNIYQLIDFNEKNKQLCMLEKGVEGELNYIHNKTDYNQAMVYAMISQNSSAYFSSNEDSFIKYQMIYKGILALKTFSNFPDCDKEISSLSDTMIKGMDNSSTILLDDKYKTDLLVMCGEISNKDKIQKFDKIVEFIKNS